MKTLVQTLKTETQTLKAQYLLMTEDWAKEEFKLLRQWANDYTTGKFGYGEASKKYHRLPYYIVNSNGNVNDHVSKMVKLAEDHYESSIEKLAFRILKKGLDESKLKIVTSHIGVNIETILTDGKKSVNAYTIIAGGQVQRPHYRYLVK